MVMAHWKLVETVVFKLCYITRHCQRVVWLSLWTINETRYQIPRNIFKEDTFSISKYRSFKIDFWQQTATQCVKSPDPACTGSGALRGLSMSCSQCAALFAAENGWTDCSGWFSSVDFKHKRICFSWTCTAKPFINQKSFYVQERRC